MPPGEDAPVEMEVKRLAAERDEAAARERALTEVLRVISASPGAVEPAFDAMLDNAIRLCDASQGVLFRWREGAFTIAAIRGHGAEITGNIGLVLHPTEKAPVAEMVRTKVALQVADLRDTEAYRHGDRSVTMAVELGKVRTSLLVPMVESGHVIGGFAIHRQQVSPFSEKQVDLVQNFAAQAVIAIENARLLAELRVALERQTATADILRVIASTPEDPRQALDTIAETAARMFNASSVHMRRVEGKLLSLVSAAGPAADVMRGAFPGVPFQAGGYGSDCILENRQIHVEDFVSASGGTPQGGLSRSMGVHTAAYTPLTQKGQAIGVMVVYRAEIRPFRPDELGLMRGFADQAVIAIENARLMSELRQRTEEIAELNRGLEARIAEQVEELSRVGRLKRFLAPQLAELIVSRGDEKILESHRREIVVVFCDLRGYTPFTETAEPEEVLDFLRQYHGALGPIVSQFEGTLDQFSGDGIMVFFNDPVPIPDPAERAVKMAAAMRDAAGSLIAAWRERGRELGFGAGIAQGYATLGQIGFSERSGYTAIGTVCNVAARLCAEAKADQILLTQRVNAALKGNIATEHIGALALKGLSQTVVAYNVPIVTNPAVFRVIEGRPPRA